MPPPGAGRNGEPDFHDQKRSNETHASDTDPDARLHRKGRGKEANLRFMGHALMENRNGLIVGAVATRASGHAERLTAVALVTPHAGARNTRPEDTFGRTCDQTAHGHPKTPDRSGAPSAAC